MPISLSPLPLQLFGPSSQRYPRYRPNPASRNHVHIVGCGTARKPSRRGFCRDLCGVAAPALALKSRHTPRSKLEYVDEVMGEIVGKMANAHAPAKKSIR